MVEDDGGRVGYDGVRGRIVTHLDLISDIALAAMRIVVRREEPARHIKWPAFTVTIRVDDAQIPLGNTCFFVNSKLRLDARVCPFQRLLAPPLVQTIESIVDVIVVPHVKDNKRRPVERVGKRIQHLHARGGGLGVGLVFEVDGVSEFLTWFHQPTIANPLVANHLVRVARLRLGGSVGILVLAVIVVWRRTHVNNTSRNVVLVVAGRDGQLHRIALAFAYEIAVRICRLRKSPGNRNTLHVADRVVVLETRYAVLISDVGEFKAVEHDLVLVRRRVGFRAVKCNRPVAVLVRRHAHHLARLQRIRAQLVRRRRGKEPCGFERSRFLRCRSLGDDGIDFARFSLYILYDEIIGPVQIVPWHL